MRRARPFLLSGAITGAVMVTLSFFIEDAVQARSTWVAGLIAAAVIAAIPIYDIDAWSLAKRSLVHVLAMLVIVFPLLLLSGWFSLPVAIGVFLLFGLVGWTIGYVVHRCRRGGRRRRADREPTVLTVRRSGLLRFRSAPRSGVEERKRRVPREPVASVSTRRSR